MSHPQKGIRSLTIIKLKFNIMKSKPTKLKTSKGFYISWKHFKMFKI